MDAETDLGKLLANMEPELQEGDYVFCSLSPDSFKDLKVEPLGWFRETEGITLILERELAARAGLKFQGLWRMITLQVHSSLEAVGFLAAVTAKLASAGVSVNPVSAYYHDHLFVPAEKGELALKLLGDLIGEAVEQTGK
ncbi:MAG: ACT domain-containing protein [Anaerolineales bacterium]|jgi:hypothetical protein